MLYHRLGNFTAAEQPDILIVGGVHGEEPDTSVLLSRALRSPWAAAARWSSSPPIQTAWRAARGAMPAVWT
ncbi:MAG: hypothetical protein R3F11_06435 [Verrucomicrobiales bacterium]